MAFPCSQGQRTVGSPLLQRSARSGGPRPQSGSGLIAIKELMGHASITQTMRYAHLAPSNRSDAVKTLDRKPLRKVVPTHRTTHRAKRQVAGE